ncbi:hypothetical protein EDEG_03520, partial [Edhazardia aedis USNM 41457]
MAKFLSNKKNFSLIIIIKLLFCENTIERIAIDFDTYNLIDHQNIYSNFICATGTLTPQKFFYILEEQGCFLVFHLFPVFCELRHTSYYCWCSVEKYNIQGERNRQIEQYIKCNHGFFVPFQPFRSQIPLKCICEMVMCRFPKDCCYNYNISKLLFRNAEVEVFESDQYTQIKAIPSNKKEEACEGESCTTGVKKTNEYQDKELKRLDYFVCNDFGEIENSKEERSRIIASYDLFFNESAGDTKPISYADKFCQFCNKTKLTLLNFFRHNIIMERDANAEFIPEK